MQGLPLVGIRIVADEAAELSTDIEIQTEARLHPITSRIVTVNGNLSEVTDPVSENRAVNCECLLVSSNSYIHATFP